MADTLTETQFTQVKHLLRAIWSQYSDEFGYRSDRIAHVDGAVHVEDGYHLVQMLNHHDRVMLRGFMGQFLISWPDDWRDIDPFRPASAL